MNTKKRYCSNCGEYLGEYKYGDWLPGDTCGQSACEREARKEREYEREEAHRQLDENRGWL